MEKQGYLVYGSKWELEKNQGFAELFSAAGAGLCMHFDAVLFSDFINILNHKSNPDFVLNRTRVEDVSVLCEERNIPVFHSSFLVRLGNDKFEAIRYLREKLPRDILKTHWVPWTEFIAAEKRDVFGAEALSKDLVLKTVDGHGGNEVIIIPADMSGKERNKIIKDFCPGKNLIMQEKIESDGRDLRVYVVGGDIYAAALRQGVNDFRSNFSLGGNVCIYGLSLRERDYIMHFVDAFGKDGLAMAGIDFIVDREGHLIFNELEEMAGTRMLYFCSDYDIVKDYVAWLRDFV